MKRLTLSTQALILLVCVGIGALFRWEYGVEIAHCTDRFRNECHQQSLEVQGSIESLLVELYEDLRTIARLPGVQTIDRYAERFGPDARRTVQEIYNNAAVRIALSEVYIVPVEFDPDAIDATTGKLQVPITTFDELILGRHLETEKSESHHEVEEIEIHEYRLMREQLATLREQFGTESKVSGLSYPAVSGPEVITCDNTRFNPAQPNEKDRSGLVYSVPFFGPDQQLKGCISGVVLSAVFRDLLSPYHALHHPQHDYTICVADNLRHDHDSIATQTADSNALYSEVLELQVPDVTGPWTLWTRYPDAYFWLRSDVRNAHRALLVGYGLAIFAALSLSALTALLIRNRRLADIKSRELEARVVSRTLELRVARDAAENANRAKSQFLASMSHELRTPLHAILSFSSFGVRCNEMTPKGVEYFGFIQNSGQVLLSLVDELLDLAKLESGKIDFKWGTPDLGSLVSAVADEFVAVTQERQVRIAINRVPNGLRVPGDSKRLMQVVRNLLSNAIKFSPPQSSVDVELRREKGEAHLTIGDRGRGIPEADLERVFDKFIQSSANSASDGGTGLGLAICREIIAIHGGRIWAEQRPGGGTWLALTLPLQVIEEGEETAPKPMQSCETP